jgi:uncharacterized alpha-E superfamily protein
VCFTLEAASRALGDIEGPPSQRRDSKADRILGRMLSDLRFVELDQVIQTDLQGFLGGLIGRCGQVGLALQEQYSLQ